MPENKLESRVCQWISVPETGLRACRAPGFPVIRLIIVRRPGKFLVHASESTRSTDP